MFDVLHKTSKFGITELLIAFYVNVFNFYTFPPVNQDAHVLSNGGSCGIFYGNGGDHHIGVQKTKIRILVNDVILGGGDQIFSDFGALFEFVIVDDFCTLSLTHPIDDYFIEFG